MCLILLSFQQNADFPLALAANRDEFYARPAAPLEWWKDSGDILAGRDLAEGGTWLGVNRYGQFAAVTNYREPGKDQKGKKSRGLLVRDFLEAGEADAYALKLQATAGDYNGFNLFFGDGQRVFYFSNRSDAPATHLKPGLYGLSNHLLDTPWPKVSKTKALFGAINPSDTTAVFTLLADRMPAADSEIQQTGLPLEIERSLSPPFIAIGGAVLSGMGSEGYGTRASSYLRFSNSGEVAFTERTFIRGKYSGELTRAFHISR